MSESPKHLATSRPEYNRRLAAKRKRQRRRRIRTGIITLLVLAVLIVGIVLICKSCSNESSTSVLNGTFEIDGYTAYEFDGKGNGAMCLGETTRYVFDYSVKDDTVSFDFEEEKINDATYKFALNGDTITLTEASGTNSYTMTKK